MNINDEAVGVLAAALLNADRPVFYNITIHRLANNTRGFAVGLAYGMSAIPTGREFMPHVDEVFLEVAARKASELMHQLRQDGSVDHISVWFDDGVLVIEPVVIVDNAEAAAVLAQANDHESFYSFELDQFVYLPVPVGAQQQQHRPIIISKDHNAHLGASYDRRN